MRLIKGRVAGTTNRKNQEKTMTLLWIIKAISGQRGNDGGGGHNDEIQMKRGQREVERGY